MLTRVDSARTDAYVEKIATRGERERERESVRDARKRVSRERTPPSAIIDDAR